jgi:hypothetical protein
VKRACRVIFFGGLAIVLAVNFIAGCSSKDNAESMAGQTKKDRTAVVDPIKLLGKVV